MPSPPTQTVAQQKQLMLFQANAIYSWSSPAIAENISSAVCRSSAPKLRQAAQGVLEVQRSRRGDSDNELLERFCVNDLKAPQISFD